MKINLKLAKKEDQIRMKNFNMCKLGVTSWKRDQQTHVFPFYCLVKGLFPYHTHSFLLSALPVIIRDLKGDYIYFKYKKGHIHALNTVVNILISIQIVIILDCNSLMDGTLVKIHILFRTGWDVLDEKHQLLHDLGSSWNIPSRSKKDANFYQGKCGVLL